MDKTGLDELLRRAQRSEPAALATLVERYSPRVFGLLMRLTGARDVAEDLMQETFLRMVRTLDRYEHVGKFESWLFRIAANLARDRARQRGRRGAMTSLDANWEDGDARAAATADRVDANPQDRLEQQEDADRLVAALGQLSESEREVLLLRHYSDLSFREIADMLKIPLGTALARAHRGLKHLRERLGDVED